MVNSDPKMTQKLNILRYFFCIIYEYLHKKTAFTHVLCVKTVFLVEATGLEPMLKNAESLINKGF